MKNQANIKHDSKMPWSSAAGTMVNFQITMTKYCSCVWYPQSYIQMSVSDPLCSLRTPTAVQPEEAQFWYLSCCLPERFQPNLFKTSETVSLTCHFKKIKHTSLKLFTCFFLHSHQNTDISTLPFRNFSGLPFLTTV